tara:strand:+ start:1259 stop:1636 length:378 start_codon:yes stop_codon:yes gene_type:complete
MLNDRLLVFEKDTIDADSVVEHSDGTNLDFFATRFSSFSSFSATERQVHMYFKDNNSIDGGNSTRSKTVVILDVEPFSEARVIRTLYRKLAGSNKKDTLFEFDALGNRFPVEDIVGINSIKRFTS